MKMIRKISYIFLLLCLFFSIFFSCSDDDDDDDTEPAYTPTATMFSPTPTETPELTDDVFNFSVTEESASTVYVDCDYSYTGSMGKATIGALPLHDNGSWLHSGFTPISIGTGGTGHVSIKVTYLGNNDYTSHSIEVFMYPQEGDIFYREAFDYTKTWSSN